MIYFMLDKNGKLGHPTRRSDMITKHLKRGTAKIIRRTKDTITVQLLNKEFHNEDTVDAEFRLGLDPGYKHIGFTVFKILNNNITKLFSGEIETRTPDITKNLADRKMYRNSRRRNRRKNIIRKYNSVKFRHPIWQNRATHKFQPTHNHLINTHLNLINWLSKHIPINKIHIEYAKFDIHKIINSNVYSFWYQRGSQYAFENVKSYIRNRDNYTCQSCKNKCLDNNEVHHIIPRSNGGTDKPNNLILLCITCHNKIHNGLIKSPAITRQYKDSSVLNSCMKELYNILSDTYIIQDTIGSIVKSIRLNSNISKTHANDASIIAFCDSLELQDIQNYNYIDLNNNINIHQYRRHDRAWVKRLEDRKYYITDMITGKSKILAWNRNKSSVQIKDSLTDLRKNSNIKVKFKPGGPIYRRSNTQRRFKPGDLINYNGIIDICKGWASTQSKVILKNHGYVRQKECNVIRNNSGLVFV